MIQVGFDFHFFFARLELTSLTMQYPAPTEAERYAYMALELTKEKKLWRQGPLSAPFPGATCIDEILVQDQTCQLPPLHVQINMLIGTLFVKKLDHPGVHVFHEIHIARNPRGICLDLPYDTKINAVWVGWGITQWNEVFVDFIVPKERYPDCSRVFLRSRPPASIGGKPIDVFQRYAPNMPYTVFRLFYREIDMKKFPIERAHGWSVGIFENWDLKIFQ